MLCPLPPRSDKGESESLGDLDLETGLTNQSRLDLFAVVACDQVLEDTSSGQKVKLAQLPVVLWSHRKSLSKRVRQQVAANAPANSLKVAWDILLGKWPSDPPGSSAMVAKASDAAKKFSAVEYYVSTLWVWCQNIDPESGLVA